MPMNAAPMISTTSRRCASRLYPAGSGPRPLSPGTVWLSSAERERQTDQEGRVAAVGDDDGDHAQAEREELPDRRDRVQRALGHRPFLHAADADRSAWAWRRGTPRRRPGPSPASPPWTSAWPGGGPGSEPRRPVLARRAPPPVRPVTPPPRRPSRPPSRSVAASVAASVVAGGSQHRRAGPRRGHRERRRPPAAPSGHLERHLADVAAVDLGVAVRAGPTAPASLVTLSKTSA